MRLINLKYYICILVFWEEVTHTHPNTHNDKLRDEEWICAASGISGYGERNGTGKKQ